MHKFLSEDWIKAYKEEWNKNQKLREELKNFSASIKYYIEGKDTSGEKLFKQPRLPEETIPNSITLKVSK